MKIVLKVMKKMKLKKSLNNLKRKIYKIELKIKRKRELKEHNKIRKQWKRRN